MTDGREGASQRENRLGGLSLICLALGIIGPFFGVLPLANHVALAFGIRGLFLLLALVLGILGRHSRAGRLGLIGTAVLLGVTAVLVLFLLFRHAVAPVSIPTPTPTLVQ